MAYIIDLENVSLANVDMVGGKNASTGEMLRNLNGKGVNIPGGFATTVSAYRDFISHNNLLDEIESILLSTHVNDPEMLDKSSSRIRDLIISTELDKEFQDEIKKAYTNLGSCAVAVRSSATAEDLDNASFAGQQDTFLNIKGINNLLHAVKAVFASLFTSRAIFYRAQHKISRANDVAISVGIQPMVNSDKGASGVIFTMDPESGFNKVILITGAYGLGETIVQGAVTPDEYYVYKPAVTQNKDAILCRKIGDKKVKMVFSTGNGLSKSTKIVPTSLKERHTYCLTDEEIKELSNQALLIEKHYKKPMDIEWAKDGLTGVIYIVQARPETVQSQRKNHNFIEQYKLEGKGNVIVRGQSVGQKISQGNVRLITNPKIKSPLIQGQILVADMTDPDWEPIMKCASAIITNQGSRTCHAAIVSRELGIPAVVGCGDATKRLLENQLITVSCAEGQVGNIYDGEVPYTVTNVSVGDMPRIPVKICMNMGNPDKAFINQFLPNEGVGLARLEFIISIMIGVHPNACIDYKSLPITYKKQINAKIIGYSNPEDYYIKKLCEGISMISSAFSPKPVIFRFSDFKSNEYRNLIGGALYEPEEENPMLGFRGASRYVDPRFKECFRLECEAFKHVRKNMGLCNAHIMVPFVRTPNELNNVISLMDEYGLRRGDNGLKIYMMCEIPSNALLADDFLQYVDGFSIGSNDLTQLTLGLDRDSSMVASMFDERDRAVKHLLQLAINACNKQGKYIGICGQGPSDHPDFAEWLMQQGIESISLNPDTIVSTWLRLANEHNKNKKKGNIPSNL